jgi:Domain of unknown function (DUF4202)
MSDPARLAAASDAIDAANAADPNAITIAGATGPKELLHGRRAAEWVLRLDPDADDAQLLAARAHHFRRWTHPRGDFPDGRAGYLRWRAAAKKAHAVEVGELLRSVGYDVDTVDRTGAIIRKEALATDPAVQVHEDALCLVFLESQFDELSDQLGDDHMVEVLLKTLRKMSPAGIEAASTLQLSDRGTRLLDRAVEGL